jgi:hypothetical protein
VCVGVVVWVGAELCVEGELCVGVEPCVEPEDTDVPVTEELLVLTADPVLVGVVFGLAFRGGACSAGTAPALVKGVMLARWALAELDWASEPVGAGADVFLIAEPTANAATSPTTSASASSSQRLRTS